MSTINFPVYSVEAPELDDFLKIKIRISKLEKEVEWLHEMADEREEKICELKRQIGVYPVIQGPAIRHLDLED